MGAVGGPDTFDSAFVRLFVLAARTARRLLRDEARAEDVAAETLARAFARWSHVEPFAEQWVTRVAVNLALDGLRREARRKEVPPADVSPEDPTSRLAVEAALARLPRRQREAVVLRYALDLDEATAADVLGISVPTLHTHVKRALARLRRPDLRARLIAREVP
jgi:RNA polymerase sigma factor (sigma-70 family)